jgi:crossover junction endodeoxyribonuclease RuvC
VIILGIDPGLVNTGFAVINCIERQRFCVLNHGIIKTKSGTDTSTRLSFIFDELCKKLDGYDFKVAALEKTLINKNAVSSMDLAMSRGVVLLYFGKRRIKYDEYLPTFVKKIITGNGSADKENIKSMIKYYIDFENSISLNLEKISHHEIDAIAIAISCGFHRRN